MKILIATYNPAKFNRYRALLTDIPKLRIVSLKDLGLTQKIDEPFETAKENALHKAMSYAKLSGLPTLSVDESVVTNFLPDNEQPGVYVRRFADKKHEMSDEETLLIWEKTLAKFPQKDKQFIWDYSISFYHPDTKQQEYAQAVNVATVAQPFSSQRLPGYPMSSFMIYQGATKPNAELSSEERKLVDRKIFKQFVTDFKGWIA